MGLDDLINRVGDAVSNAASTVGRDLGQATGAVVDEGAHVLAAGLNDLGLSAAARTVSRTGDTVADHLGDVIPEKQLGQSTDPTDLVHGDPSAIEGTATRLRAFAAAFAETARGLRDLDTTYWTGRAADAFRQRYQNYSPRWCAADDASAAAASAWQHYAEAVRAAQQQAGEAIARYEQGVQTTAQAKAGYQQAVATYQQQANTYTRAIASGGNPGPVPAAPGPFTDPGAPARQQAQDLLDRARRQRDAAADHAAQQISATLGLAPATPTFTQRLTNDLADAVTIAAVSDLHVTGGVIKGVGDLGKSVRSIAPIDPYNATHPAAYVDGLSTTAAGLVRDSANPLAAVPGILGSGWSTDPAQAAGRLVPTVVGAIATDGGGAAADTADAARAADTTGAADRASGAAQAIGPQAVPSSANPTAATADTTMSDPAGPASTATDAPQTAHTGPDTAAAQALDATAAPGLHAVEQDLAQIHVHTPEPTPTAAGPGDPGGGAGGSGDTRSTADLSPLRQRLAGLNPKNVTTAPEAAPTPGTVDTPGGPAEGGTGPVTGPGSGNGAGGLAGHPQVHADLAQTALQHPDLAQLDALDETPVWRRDSHRLYRSDNRGPAVFTDGFPVRDINNLKLGDYVKNNTPSGFVSATIDPGYWRMYGAGANYFYEIDAPGGIDVNATLGKHTHDYENEIAMPGGIRPDRVKGLWRIDHDYRSGAPSLGQYIPNPNYRPLSSG